jgi:hypothetical protein
LYESGVDCLLEHENTLNIFVLENRKKVHQPNGYLLTIPLFVYFILLKFNVKLSTV